MTLKQIQSLVSDLRYNYSNHIRVRIEAGEFGEEDLEHCIRTAKSIYKVEWDELKTAVDGKKYVILGKDTYGCLFYTCGKVIKDEEGKLYFFITANEADLR